MKFDIRPSLPDDLSYLINWLSDPLTRKWFPISNHKEVEDASRIWLNYLFMKACFTSLVDDVPAGISTLYIGSYTKTLHQTLLAIVVDSKYRNLGVGKKLLEYLIEVAKKNFKIEILHLEVYEGNPAIRLYKRLGFEKYGEHPRFIQLEDGSYLTKVLMQKLL